MPKGSRLHHGDEFSKTGSGSPVTGIDAPIIGAASTITVDGIVERESGVTPPPPPVSVKALIIVFAVIFVLGIAGVWFLIKVTPHEAPYGGTVPRVQQALPADAPTGK